MDPRGVTRRDGLKGAAALTVAGAAFVPATGSGTEAASTTILEDLAITVPRDANRQVVFTNKVSAVWLTQTHANDHPEHAWFAGLNVAKKKVMGDYGVWAGGAALDRTTATVTVWPDRMERRYPGGITETLRFHEGRVLVDILLAGAPAGTDIRLSGDGVAPAGTRDGVAFFTPGDGAPGLLGLARQGSRFMIALDADEAAVIAALNDGFASADRLAEAQCTRLAGLVSGDHLFECSDKSIETAVRWMTLTMDRLVMDQGDRPGIYAGLPWFNEYWGRDSFIALPGALLVTGQFETARKILVSFAQYMDMDPASKFYGRVPNIVQPDNLDYHSADGTPRWVLAVEAYVNWSGDTSIIEELKPHLVASIEGGIKHWVNGFGFLTHADNETWMDARRQPDLKPYSPRGSSARDVQALWHSQLAALQTMGISGDVPEFAGRLPDIRSLTYLRALILERYKDQRTGPEGWPARIAEQRQARIADRRTAEGANDWTVRPNGLFLADELTYLAAQAQIVEECVYPWGVASLSNRHPCFHPFHIAPLQDGTPLWHKDEAYHNGAVWQWLSGVAIEALINLERVDLAWQLFAAGCGDALNRGCVGGLAENSDAYPVDSTDLPALTGTCLQAWSNAEHLRVLTEAFAGIRPRRPRFDSGIHGAEIMPRPSAGHDHLKLACRIADSTLHWTFTRDGQRETHTWRPTGRALDLSVTLAPGLSVGLQRPLLPGQTLTVVVDNGAATASLMGPDQAAPVRVGVGAEAYRTWVSTSIASAFASLEFAKPRPLAEHHAMTGQCRSGIGP